MGFEHMSDNTSTITMPICTGLAVGTGAAVTIVQPVPTRRGVIMHNPNATNMWVAPIGTTPAVAGAGSTCILPFASLILLGDLRANCGWQAIMQTTPGFSTVLDFQA
jgi:hypothetical protein